MSKADKIPPILPSLILTHQACTGGTIISRVLNAHTSAIVLSEISPAAQAQPVRFDPLFPITQFARRYPDLIDAKTIHGDFFDWQAKAISDRCIEAGKVLIWRDHAHSVFMDKCEVAWGLTESLSRLGPVRTVMTVRHPISSYISLLRSFPGAFDGGFENYCDRYLRYLDQTLAVETFKYEDFCVDPVGVIETIKRAFSVRPHAFGAVQDWRKITLTGNSGRMKGADTIRPLPVAGVDIAGVARATSGMASFNLLCDRLGYETDFREYAAALTEQSLQWDLGASGDVVHDKPSIDAKSFSDFVSWRPLCGLLELEGPYPELGVFRAFRWGQGEVSRIRLRTARRGRRSVRIRVRNVLRDQILQIETMSGEVLATQPLLADIAHLTEIDINVQMEPGDNDLVLRAARTNPGGGADVRPLAYALDDVEIGRVTNIAKKKKS